jgi:hypothetical protein
VALSILIVGVFVTACEIALILLRVGVTMNQSVTKKVMSY